MSNSFPPIPDIQNGEEGGVVREKLNAVIGQTNKQWDHADRQNNPHNVKAPQVKLEPALAPLGANEQNVQDALEFLLERSNEGAGMVISATEPKDPETGMQWLDSTTAKVWIWDEDKWLEFPVTGSGGDGSTVQIEDLPPTTHKVGDTWVDYGTTGEMYVWDGRFWVSMTGDGGPKVIIGGGEGGLPPDVELPENITLDQVESVEDFDQALARFIDPSNKGKWGRIKTSDILTNPDVTFRDSKGRFKSTKDYEGLTDQLKVNRFLAGEIESLSAEIDGIEFPETDLSDYAKTEYVDSEIEAEKLERSLADIALRDSLQAEIDALDPYDDTAINDALAEEVAAREAGDQALQGQIDSIDVALPGEVAKPVDIGTQTLKITGSRPVGAAGEAGNMLCWKAETGGPGSPFNEIKFIVPDTSVIDLSANQLWLKQGNAIQRWDTAGGGWFTNGNVLHVSGNLTEGDDLIDGQPVEMYYSDPDSFYLEVISKEESKADDQALQAQIDGIDFPAGTIVSDTAPLDPEDGATWYDTVRLELFVYGLDAWLPCSPLGARVEQGEVLQAQILSRVEAGEAQQQTLVDTKLGKAEANEVANSFRIKGAGGTYISTSGSQLGLYHVKYPESEAHAATMGYVDDEIAKVSMAGGGPTNKYDGNRFSVSGTSTKSLSSGDVMFLSGDASTNSIPAVNGIALPESEFDWDACAKSGVVKVKNGAKVAGYFQVYDIARNEGRNVILNVSLLHIGDYPSVDYESGAPCYFHGVFFA